LKIRNSTHATKKVVIEIVSNLKVEFEVFDIIKIEF